MCRLDAVRNSGANEERGEGNQRGSAKILLPGAPSPEHFAEQIKWQSPDNDPRNNSWLQHPPLKKQQSTVVYVPFGCSEK